MNPIDLPDYEPTEAHIREIVAISERGKLATERLEGVFRNLLSLAHSRRVAHQGYTHLTTADPYNRVLTDTVYCRYCGGLLDLVIDEAKGVVTLHCVLSGCRGGDDQHLYHDLPLAWAWTPHPEMIVVMDRQLDALVEGYHQRKRDAAAAALATEKGQLAMLLAKHGAPTS